MSELYYEPKERPIPRATGWKIDCPGCGEDIEYLPDSDDDRTFFLHPEDWPVCHGCMLILEPETVEIRIKATKRSPLLTPEDIAE